MIGADGAGLSVIVACFNEESTIGECLDRLAVVVPAAEILVVCGGTDATLGIARARAATHPGMRVLRNYGDSGKGHAVKLGITLASHDLMMQCDADLQFAPEEIPALLSPILEGRAEVAVGARFAPGSNCAGYTFSFLRTFGNQVVNGYVSKLTAQRFHDVTSGFKAWTREAIEAIPFRDNRFVYELEVAMRPALAGYRVAMVPVTYFNRKGGVSGHGSGWRETWSIVRTGVTILVRATMIRLSLW